jgi:mono/diheme cytochrome c family protein
MAGLVPAMPRLAPVVMMRAFIGYVALPIAIASMLALVGASATAEEGRSFPNEQIAAGAELYAVNCSPCHGARMLDPGAAFNLRKFPPDQRERFVNSITRGKNQMPPWGDFFKPDQLDALWAYVMAGER